MGKKKSSNPQGRQGAFSGEKLKFLMKYKEEWAGLSDRGALYTQIAKEFIIQYGYDLPFEDNPPEDAVPPLTEIDPLLSPEDALKETERRGNIYVALRNKLSNWYRHRLSSRNTNQAYINKIIDRISSLSVSRPRKRTVINMYSKRYWKKKLKPMFDPIWKAAKNSMQLDGRIKLCNEFVRTSWEAETEVVKEEITRETHEENEAAIAEWKKKAIFSGSAEGYDEAWRTADWVLPVFADAMAEWLGASVIILSVSPLGSADGEITLQTAQSDTSKGMTRKLFSEFNLDGFAQMHDSLLAYGKAYFTPEECKRRVLDSEGLERMEELPLEGTEAEGTETEVPLDATVAMLADDQLEPKSGAITAPSMINPGPGTGNSELTTAGHSTPARTESGFGNGAHDNHSGFPAHHGPPYVQSPHLIASSFDNTPLVAHTLHLPNHQSSNGPGDVAMEHGLQAQNHSVLYPPSTSFDDRLLASIDPFDFSSFDWNQMPLFDPPQTNESTHGDWFKALQDAPVGIGVAVGLPVPVPPSAQMPPQTNESTHGDWFKALQEQAPIGIAAPVGLPVPSSTQMLAGIPSLTHAPILPHQAPFGIVAPVGLPVPVPSSAQLAGISTLAQAPALGLSLPAPGQLPPYTEPTQLAPIPGTLPSGPLPTPAAQPSLSSGLIPPIPITPAANPAVQPPSSSPPADVPESIVGKGTNTENTETVKTNKVRAAKKKTGAVGPNKEGDAEGKAPRGRKRKGNGDTDPAPAVKKRGRQKKSSSVVVDSGDEVTGAAANETEGTSESNKTPDIAVTRSGRTISLPDHLKGGYEPPKKGMRATKGSG